MRVLIACESSGMVRNAFRALGHDAWSCDLLPEDTPTPDGWNAHYRGDIFECFRDMPEWDLMIAHPPCTDLAVSGARWFREKGPARQALALAFVQALMDASVPRICIENPVSIISSRIRKPDQIIQPWMFGHDASKKTCLWLKGLPRLVPTDVLSGGHRAIRANQTPSGQNRLGPSPDRWKLRAATYSGIAAAMAEQWGGLDKDHRKDYLPNIETRSMP